jgi:hypothetical protein
VDLSVCPSSEQSGEHYLDFMIQYRPSHLLMGSDIVQYHETHQLMFGYFNKIPASNNNLKGINPVSYIVTSLDLVSPTAEVIDFILPLNFKEQLVELKDGHQSIFTKMMQSLYSIEGISNYFKEHPEMLQQYHWEFWKKNSQGTMELLEHDGVVKN